MLQRLHNPRRGMRAACAFAIFLVACPPKDPERLEIFPTHVQLAPDIAVDVVITAHVRGSDGIVATANPIVWTSVGPPTPGVAITGTGGRIVVSVGPSVPDGTRFAFQATSGLLPGETVEFEVLSIGVNTLDRAVANHTGAAPPAAALITSEQTSTCRVDSVFPFAHRTDLGDWGPGCPTNKARAAVFVTDRRPIWFDAYSWKASTAGPDIFDAVTIDAMSPADLALESNRTYPYQTVPLRIRVFNGVTVDKAFKSRVFWDVTTASGKFTEALAGVAFTYDETTITEIPATVKSCMQLSSLLAANPAWQDPNAMNVYYAPNLVWSRRGYFCGTPSTVPNDHGRPQPANQILVSTTNYSPTTLAHELGHSLGMLEPWTFRGHVDQVDGMASDNLMWANVDDLTAATRFRLSIGQIFRINRDTRSWLTNPDFHAVPDAIDCGCDPYKPGPCPRLSADVRKIGNVNPTLPGGTCP